MQKHPSRTYVRVGVRVLVEVAHDGEKGRAVAVEARPGVRTEVGQAVFLPRRNGEQRLRHRGAQFQVGKQVEFLGIGGPKVRRPLLSDRDLHASLQKQRGCPRKGQPRKIQQIFKSIVCASSISTTSSFCFSSAFITSLKRLKPICFSSKSG